LGRRAAKQLNGQPTQFVYDGADIVQHADSLGTTSYLRSLTIDEALGFTNRDGTYFSIYDPLGSTTAVLDQAATPKVQYTYEPFGTTFSTKPTFPNPFQFTGRENDGTGLYYYRARYYHPILSRFLSEDPLGLGSRSVNFYTYVLNNPVRAVDPSGLLDTRAPGRGGPDTRGFPRQTRAEPRQVPTPPPDVGVPRTPQQGGPHVPGTPGTESPKPAPSTSKAARGASGVARALDALMRLGAAIGQALGGLLRGVQPILYPEDIIRCAMTPEPQRCLRNEPGVAWAATGDDEPAALREEDLPQPLPGRK
jgi:RHS repeat-associated protein